MPIKNTFMRLLDERVQQAVERYAEALSVCPEAIIVGFERNGGALKWRLQVDLEAVDNDVEVIQKCRDGQKFEEGYLEQSMPQAHRVEFPLIVTPINPSGLHYHENETEIRGMSDLDVHVDDASFGIEEDHRGGLMFYWRGDDELEFEVMGDRLDAVETTSENYARDGSVPTESGWPSLSMTAYYFPSDLVESLPQRNTNMSMGARQGIQPPFNEAYIRRQLASDDTQMVETLEALRRAGLIEDEEE